MSYCDGDDPFEDARPTPFRKLWLGLGLGWCSVVLLGVASQLV